MDGRWLVCFRAPGIIGMVRGGSGKRWRRLQIGSRSGAWGARGGDLRGSQSSIKDGSVCTTRMTMMPLADRFFARRLPHHQQTKPRGSCRQHQGTAWTRTRAGQTAVFGPSALRSPDPAACLEHATRSPTYYLVQLLRIHVGVSTLSQKPLLLLICHELLSYAALCTR